MSALEAVWTALMAAAMPQLRKDFDVEVREAAKAGQLMRTKGTCGGGWNRPKRRKAE
jgi:hypothetical protein